MSGDYVSDFISYVSFGAEDIPMKNVSFTIDPEDAKRYREKLLEHEEGREISLKRSFETMKLFLFVSDYSDKIGVFVGAKGRKEAEELVYKEMRNMVYNQRDGMSDVVPDDFFTAFDVRAICKIRSYNGHLEPFADICNNTEGHEDIDLKKKQRGVPELTMNELKLLDFAFTNLDESTLTSVNSEDESCH